MAEYNRSQPQRKVKQALDTEILRKMSEYNRPKPPSNRDQPTHPDKTKQI